jgi:hypothetical protein
MGGGFDAAFGRVFAWRVLDLNYSHSWLPEVHSIISFRAENHRQIFLQAHENKAWSRPV